MIQFNGAARSRCSSVPMVINVRSGPSWPGYRLPQGCRAGLPAIGHPDKRGACHGIVKRIDSDLAEECGNNRAQRGPELTEENLTFRFQCCRLLSKSLSAAFLGQLLLPDSVEFSLGLFFSLALLLCFACLLLRFNLHPLSMGLLVVQGELLGQLVLGLFLLLPKHLLLTLPQSLCFLLSLAPEVFFADQFFLCPVTCTLFKLLGKVLFFLGELFLLDVLFFLPLLLVLLLDDTDLLGERRLCFPQHLHGEAAVASMVEPVHDFVQLRARVGEVGGAAEDLPQLSVVTLEERAAGHSEHGECREELHGGGEEGELPV